MVQLSISTLILVSSIILYFIGFLVMVFVYKIYTTNKKKALDTIDKIVFTFFFVFSPLAVLAGLVIFPYKLVKYLIKSIFLSRSNQNVVNIKHKEV